MNDALRAAYLSELEATDAALAGGDFDAAFRHLERAHILSQRFTLQHVHVHWRMFRLGMAVRDGREIGGQLTRMIAAALFSRIWIPEGNTGRANVSALRPMPVPDDLRVLLAQDGG